MGLDKGAGEAEGYGPCRSGGAPVPEKYDVKTAAELPASFGRDLDHHTAVGGEVGV